MSAVTFGKTSRPRRLQFPSRWAGLAATALLAIHTPQTGSATPLSLPYQEQFSAPELDASWAVASSEGTTAALQEGRFWIEAADAATAHLQRPLQKDHVTASARLYRGGSIYLVWDERNWCGIGKTSPTPFGRFYSTATADGTTTETDHRWVHFDSHHLMRVQLGTDCIRFQSQGDEGQWTTLRTIARPAGYRGAPAFLVAGKQYHPGQNPLTAAARPEKPGPDAKLINGSIDDISVDTTPASELAMTATERQWLHWKRPEPVTALLAEGDEDPTYERIVPHYPPMRFPREAVGVDEHPLDIGVDWLGRLDVSPWAGPIAWFEIGAERRPFAEKSEAVTRRLLDGWMPVVSLKTKHDTTECEMTVLGWSENFETSKPLQAIARLTFRNSDAAALPRKVAVLGHNNVRVELDTAPGPDATRQVDLQFDFPKPETARRLNAGEFDRIVAETKQYWSRRIAGAERFTTPDPRVNEAYRAWLVYSAINSDLVNGYVEPHDGTGFYDLMFGHSVSLHAMMQDQYGMHDLATRILETQLNRQRPDGSYSEECGLPDLGQLLVAVAIHESMTGDREWLKRVTPHVLKAYEWIRTQRAKTPESAITNGLIKFRPYNDHPEPVYNYLGNSLCADGLARCAAALGGIGMTREAEALAAEARSYRADILASMDASTFVHDGMRILPIEPDTRRIEKISKYRGGDYYGLIASPILATGIFDFRDRKADDIIAMLEQRRGLIAGVCEFMEGIDHAYTYGYLMNSLQRNDARKYLLGFWSIMAFGMTRDTYSPVEVTMIETGENHYTLPHLYSCTEQLRLLRNMLVREDGDGLVFGQAIPRAWLEPGKRTEITSAPTTLGPVNCLLEAEGTDTVRITLTPPTRRQADFIRIHLRHPSRKDIVEVTSSSGEKVEIDGETMTLKDPTRQVELLARFGEAKSITAGGQ